MKFRKKPVVIEAEQFNPKDKPWPNGVKLKYENPFLKQGPIYYVVTIHRQETKVVKGDWIIQEPDGKHYYPCKPDIFEDTYTRVEP